LEYDVLPFYKKKTKNNGFLKSWKKSKLKLDLLKVELLNLNLNGGLLNLFPSYKIKEDALRSSLWLFNSSSYHNFIVLVNVLMFPFGQLLCLHKIQA
jgi:hypothetical protein